MIILLTYILNQNFKFDALKEMSLLYNEYLHQATDDILQDQNFDKHKKYPHKK